MSSACVCHTDKFCFYCEMYSPLEQLCEVQQGYLAHKQEHIESQAKEIETLGNIVSALDGHDTTFLWQIRTKLKQDFGGEGWAIGEMVERAIKLLGNEKFVIQIKGGTP